MKMILTEKTLYEIIKLINQYNKQLSSIGLWIKKIDTAEIVNGQTIAICNVILN